MSQEERPSAGPPAGGVAQDAEENLSDSDLDLANEIEQALEEAGNQDEDQEMGTSGAEQAAAEQAAADSNKFLTIANDMMDDDYDADGYNPTPTEPSSAFASGYGAGPLGSTAPMASQQYAEPVEQTDMDSTARKKEEIFNSLTEEQKDRYEAFMRASLPKPKIKKLMQSVMGSLPSDKAIIAMQGIAKLHLGEIVETAREMARLEGYQGPLLPRHIRRAYTELNTQRKVPHFRGRKGRPLR